MCERKQAKQHECLPREQFVQGKKYAGKKVSASRVLDLTLKISKTLQQRNTIPNSAGTKKLLKAMNMLMQRRDNFQFGGEDKLNLKVFFTSHKSRLVFSEIWKY